MSDNGPEPIAAILDYRNEQIIYEVEGKLTKLYKAKDTQHGQLQNGEIVDAEGTMCKITFADAAVQEMTARGKTINIQAANSDAHGWTGCKFKYEEKYGAQIWVTSSAVIDFPGGGGGGQASNRRPQSEGRPQGGRPQQGREQGRPQGRAQQGRPQQGQAKPREQAQQFDQYGKLDQIIDCFFVTHRLVNEKVNALFPGANPDFLERLVTQGTPTIFIEAAKAMVVANWQVGAERKKVYPKPPEDPKEWRRAVIPSGSLEGKSLDQLSDEQIKTLFDYYDSQGANGRLAECVYEAANELGVLKPPPGPAGKPSDPDLDAPEDDIPF